jgi:hypothetical protein
MDLDDLFLFEARRKVHKDRTVSLDGVIYEVEAHLVGDTVTLRYDPQRRTLIQVWQGGKQAKDAKVVDAYANAHVRRGEHRGTLLPSTPARAPAKGLTLRSLRREADEEVK